MKSKNNDLTTKQEADLDDRYRLFLQNPKIGKSWTELKAQLLENEIPKGMSLDEFTDT